MDRWAHGARLDPDRGRGALLRSRVVALPAVADLDALLLDLDDTILDDRSSIDHCWQARCGA
jgi:hypothetical protein